MPDLSQIQLQGGLLEALRRYPDLTTLPLAISTGKGPYQSETYEPSDPENPLPGKLNIQLRSARSKSPQTLPEWIAFEAIHGLQQSDPIYQQFHKAFKSSMTPAQLANSRQVYEQEKINHGERRSFDQFLDIAEVPEYIRGHVFSNVIPGWTGPQGEGQYTPEQEGLLTMLRHYLVRGPQEPLRK